MPGESENEQVIADWRSAYQFIPAVFVVSAKAARSSVFSANYANAAIRNGWFP
jgi:hypothetical protein